MGRMAAIGVSIAVAVACSSQSETSAPAPSSTQSAVINTNQLLNRPVTFHSRFGDLTFQKNGGLVVGPGGNGGGGTITGITPNPTTGTTPTPTGGPGTGTISRPGSGFVVVPGATPGTFSVTPEGGSGTMEINGQRYVLLEDATSCSGDDDLYMMTTVGIDAAGFTATTGGAGVSISNLKLAFVGGFLGSAPNESGTTNYNVFNLGQYMNDFIESFNLPSNPFGSSNARTANGSFNAPGFTQTSAFLYAGTFTLDVNAGQSANVTYAFHFPTQGRLGVTRMGDKTRVALNYGAVRSLRITASSDDNVPPRISSAGGGIFTFNVECGGSSVPN